MIRHNFFNLKEATRKPLKLISAKLQGTRPTHKNQLCFYIPEMNDLKKKLRTVQASPTIHKQIIPMKAFIS